MSKDEVDAPRGERWVQEGDGYVIKEVGMKKPECGCFKSRSGDHKADSDGEAKVLTIGVEMMSYFTDLMGQLGMCRESFDYAMVTAVVLIMKQTAAQHAKGDRYREEEVFHEQCTWIAAAVRARGDEMRAEALNSLLDADAPVPARTN